MEKDYWYKRINPSLRPRMSTVAMVMLTLSRFGMTVSSSPKTNGTVLHRWMWYPRGEVAVKRDT